jgi:uncharacterized membrane protein YtjA (UPF0391 family)
LASKAGRLATANNVLCTGVFRVIEQISACTSPLRVEGAVWSWMAEALQDLPGHNFVANLRCRATFRSPEPILIGYLVAVYRLEELTNASLCLGILIIAIVAAILGFGVVAGTAATIAKFCFVAFLVIFIASFLMGRRSAV